MHGLVALMELQASRLAARVGRGAPVLLPDQDRRRWDRLLIRRGLAALAQAEMLGGAGACTCCRPRSPPVMRGRRRRRHRLGPDRGALWRARALTGSPVVELNRAVAVGMAAGPAAGLALVDRLAAGVRCSSYHLLDAVRGDFLARLGRGREAKAAFERAARLTRNEAERGFLLGRAAACANGQ